jgi:hypothetical protein
MMKLAAAAAVVKMSEGRGWRLAVTPYLRVDVTRTATA